jgi:hypothetical protein
MEAIDAADGGGQAVLRAVEAESAGFPIVVGKDGKAGAVFGREGVSNGGNLGDELGPADFV